MEKITETSTDDMRLSDWLRVAIGSVAASEPGQIHFPVADGYSDNNDNSHLTAAHRFHPIHSHPHPEIAICTSGTALMELDGISVSLQYPSVMALAPNVPHCHSSPLEKEFHSTLWLLFFRDNMLVSNCLYHPIARWGGKGSIPRQGKSIEKFQDSLCSPLYLDLPDGKERFRMDLLDVLNSTYQQQGRNELAGSDNSTYDPASHAPLLQYLGDYIENNVQEPITLEFLGHVARLSPNHLNTLFKQHYGVTLHAHLIRCRMTQAMELLRNTGRQVKKVASDVGYNDPLYFSRAFHKYHGAWPSEVKRNGRSCFS